MQNQLSQVISFQIMFPSPKSGVSHKCHDCAFFRNFKIMQLLLKSSHRVKFGINFLRITTSFQKSNVNRPYNFKFSLE